jgi:hypothetical protein
MMNDESQLSGQSLLEPRATSPRNRRIGQLRNIRGVLYSCTVTKSLGTHEKSFVKEEAGEKAMLKKLTQLP